MFVRKKFADSLLSLRKFHGMTRDALAKACGISTVTVQKLETGERAPSIEVFCSIAEYFGVSLDELAGYTAEQSTKELDTLYHELLYLTAKERDEALRFIRFIKQDR